MRRPRGPVRSGAKRWWPYACLSSLPELNAAGQQVARERIAVAQVDVVEGGGRRGRNLLHDQERDLQAVADAEPRNVDGANRVIESDRLDLGRVEILARARILHLLAVLVVVFAGVFVRLEARLFALGTGEGPVGVSRVTSAPAPAPAPAPSATAAAALGRFRIERRKEAETTLLPHHRRQPAVGAAIGAGIRGALAAITPGRIDPIGRHTSSSASVGVRGLNPAVAIDRDFVEVQKVATWVAATRHPDASALDRVVGGRVHGGPGLASVVGKRHVEVPGASERTRLIVAGRRRSQERDRGTVPIADDHFRKLGVFDPERSADVA